MAAEDVALALQVPGRLCYNPTQNGLLTSFPHGGTAIGFVKDVFVDETQESVPVIAEELGRKIKRIKGVTGYVFGFRLVQWDPDGLALLYQTQATSAGGYQSPKTLREDTTGLESPLAYPILFSPDDSAHPGVLIYGPLPFMGPGGARRLHFQIARGLEVDAYFDAMPDSTGNVLAIDKLEHLSLTPSVIT